MVKIERSRATMTVGIDALIVNILHRVSKNVAPLGCSNCETWERILIFFERNVTHKISNPETYYYVTSNNLCFCTMWQNGETRKSHFHWNAVLVHCLNSTSCLITGSIAWSARRWYLIYSEADFEVFRPQGRHIAPMGWNLALRIVPNFTAIGATLRV